MAAPPTLTVRIAANIDALQAALAQAQSGIQVTTAGMNKLAASFSGDKLVQQAVNMAAAIEKVGGVSKLTEAELARANRVFEAAAQKMTVLGSEGAAAMRQLADSTKAVKQPIEDADKATQSWAQSFSATLAGFLSAQAIWSAVTTGLNLVVSAIGAVKDALVSAVLSTADLGDEMLTLSTKTGISVEKLSEWRYVAGQTGTSVEQITGSVFKLQASLGEGGKKTEQALNAIGLSVAQLRAQRPDEAFESVLAKLRQLPAESDKAAVGVALFGKGFKDMANLTREDIGALRERFQQLGGTISTELAVAGDAFNDARGDWNVLVERMNTSIGAAILPAATAFVNIMVDAVAKALNESSLSATQFQASVTNAFAAAVDVSGLVLQAIGLLVQGFAELFTGKWTQETAGLVSAIGLVGTNVTNLGQAVALFNGQAGLAGMFEKLRAGFVETMRVSTAVAIAGRESERVLATLGESMGRIGAEMKGKGAAALDAVRAQIQQTAAAMRTASAQAGDGIGLLAEAVTTLGRQIDFSDEKLRALMPRIQAVTLPLARLREGGIETARSFGTLNQTLGVEMDAAMRRATVASQAATDRMVVFRTGIRDTTADLGGMSGALDAAAQVIGQFGDDSKDAALAQQALGLAVQVAGAFATKAGADAATAASQAALEVGKYEEAQKQAAIATQLNAQASVQFGLALINVIGAIGQYQLAQQAIEAAAYRAGRAQHASAVELLQDLQATLGSLQAIGEFSRLAGVDLSAFLEAASGPFRNRRMLDAEDYREAIEMVERFVQTAVSGMARYNLSWADMPKVADRLRMATFEGQKLQETFEALVKIGFDAQTAAGGMAVDLNEWLNQALRAGIEIPAAFQPMLDALIRSGELSQENARLLLGIADAGVPSLDEVTAAAERYGIALEDLGPKVQQLQIDEAAKQLVDDWNVLSAATDDVSVIFAGMGEDVQQLVDDAIRYGAELPAAMRPMLQAFIDAGELVDENGQKITDLSQLNFAEDLTAQVDRLIEKLDELIGSMLKIPPAAGGIVGGIGGIGAAATSAATAVEGLAAKTDAAAQAMSYSFVETGEEVDDLQRRIEEWGEGELNKIPITAVDEASGVIEDVQEALDQLPPEVSINVKAGLREAESAGFKTRAELEAAAATAERIYESMRASGQFTQGEITRAFRAWQTALEAIDPSPLGRVAAAGYKTRDELQAAANDARTIWETMVQSGRFTADEIQRAWEDWQDKLEATGTDGLTKKVRDELKSLKDYVATEVPEFDELGNRIFGVEEQRAIDRIAEIEAQVAASQAAIQTATGTAGTEIEGAMEDAQGAGEDAFEAIESGAEDAALKAKAVWQAGSDLQTLFAAADYETPFEEGRDAAERMRREVDLLQRSVDAVSFGRSPGGLKEWSPMLTAAALTAASASDRMVSDYDRIAQAVNRVTFGSGSFEAGLSTVSTVGPLGFGSAGVSGEANALTELRAIRRALSEQQPDVLFVPLKPGDSMQSLEDRLADQLPRRIMQSASFRNAMQRAINGGA